MGKIKRLKDREHERCCLHMNYLGGGLVDGILAAEEKARYGFVPVARAQVQESKRAAHADAQGK